jgi:hypothetical protein
MNIIDSAVKIVISPELDPNSREFMLEAFKEASPPDFFDPWKTDDERLEEAFMPYSSMYNEILEKLMKDHTDGDVNN